MNQSLKSKIDYMKTYGKLCTEFYVTEKKLAFGKELALYSDLLQPKEGPFLEAMCGSGRLLIPLLENGINIDGVDSSAFMLEKCKKECQTRNLYPELLQQSVTELSLQKRYAGIIVAMGSFQLLTAEEAYKSLRAFKDHLLPGGFLVLELFIPWDSIKKSIDGDHLLDKVVMDLPSRPVKYHDNATLKLSSHVIIYPKEQRKIAHSRYEKYSSEGILEEAEQEEFNLQWYYVNEMLLILEKIGFSDIHFFEMVLEENPHALIFKAIK